MRHYVRKSVILSLAAAVLFASSDAFAQTAKVSDLLKNTVTHSSNLTVLISLIGYLAGAYYAVVGIYKFKDHVDNPQQTPLSAGVKRYLAGGMFLSLPFMSKVASGSLFSGTINSNQTSASALAAGDGTAGALDTMVLNFMNDVSGPMGTLLSFFCYISGFILLLVSISRLTQKIDQGPRGPAGLGTVMTFITSGVLFAIGDIIGAFANSLFGDNKLATKATVTVAGMAPEDATKIENVIQALMYFVLIVGIIAFIRGWFVLRAFADGQQGATLAQGLTFLFGGALAMNLGDLVNALEGSIGLADPALKFSF